jgi:hypothetical protein
MDNKIAGVIGMSMIVAFLGFYAIKLNSIPLWIIIVGVLAMSLVEFYESMTSENGDEGN